MHIPSAIRFFTILQEQKRQMLFSCWYFKICSWNKLKNGEGAHTIISLLQRWILAFTSAEQMVEDLQQELMSLLLDLICFFIFPWVFKVLLEMSSETTDKSNVQAQSQQLLQSTLSAIQGIIPFSRAHTELNHLAQWRTAPRALSDWGFPWLQLLAPYRWSVC